MSETLIGEVETFPWLTVRVEASGGTRDVRFLVDTGFNGELAVPRSYTALFGTSTDTYDVRFADGDEAAGMTVSCRVDWVDGPRDVIALYIDGENPLLGMELLDGCLVTLATENGEGELTVEANQ